MAKRDGHLHELLAGYARFLHEKNLALDKHQPYVVRSSGNGDPNQQIRHSLPDAALGRKVLADRPVTC